MLIMEIKFWQLLFVVQKRTILCNLEIVNIWIEEYKRFRKPMLAIRSIALIFVLFCWKASKKFCLITKKSDFDSVFLNLKMLKSHKISVVQELTHVQLLTQKLKVLLKSLFTNIRAMSLSFVALRTYALNK